MATLEEYLETNRPTFEQDLFELLRIPSVSADPAFHDQVLEAGRWVAQQLAAMGLATETIETPGSPLIYAESPAVPGAPTVLVYGHYDVQPPDPLDEWTTPAFEPTVRDGNVYARGATDDKGQMLTHLMSVRAWLASRGDLPVQVKFLIEGEEEVGSENLEDFLAKNRDKLACDCVVISDTSQYGPGQPAITYGLRGIVCYELRVTGPKQDLHSGSFGGAVVNPANALCRMMASLHDAQGRVCIPGFYDGIQDLADSEREQLANLPFDESQFGKQLGVAALDGEAGFTTNERRWTRPTLDINGITTGYQGAGPKTVIPARASVKFSCRLVPNQDPKKIDAAVRDYLQSQLPEGVTMELQEFHGAPGVVVPLESPYIRAAARAIEKGFGTAPVFIREGGSIPIVTQFHEELGADVLLLGWGQNDDNMHSPNEKFSLDDFQRGIRSSAYLIEELAALAKS